MSELEEKTALDILTDPAFAEEGPQQAMREAARAELNTLRGKALIADAVMWLVQHKVRFGQRVSKFDREWLARYQQVEARARSATEKPKS